MTSNPRQPISSPSDDLSPVLDAHATRLIGWGAGEVFQAHYPLLNLALEYTVCPYPRNQGKVIHGVEVKAPAVLMREPRGRVQLVIFARQYIQIMEQIRTIFGDYRVILALGYDSDPIYPAGFTSLRHK